MPRLIMMFKVILMEEAVFFTKTLHKSWKIDGSNTMSWRFGSDDFPLHLGDF